METLVDEWQGLSKRTVKETDLNNLNIHNNNFKFGKIREILTRHNKIYK